MDLRQLTTLVAIADHGSFSAAARALYTVQSNVSGHVARLERELGVTLVDRQRGGLTDEGVIVVDRARRVLHELDDLAAEMASRGDEVTGDSRLGVIGTTARWLLPQLLGQVSRTAPAGARHHPRGQHQQPAPPPAGLTDRRGNPAPARSTSPSCRSSRCSPKTCCCWPTAASAWPDAIRSSLKELARIPLLLPPRGTALRRIIDRAAAAVDVELQAQAEIDGVRLLASLAFEGYGPAIVPATVGAALAEGRLPPHPGARAAAPRRRLGATASTGARHPHPSPAGSASRRHRSARAQATRRARRHRGLPPRPRCLVSQFDACPSTFASRVVGAVTSDVREFDGRQVVWVDVDAGSRVGALTVGLVVARSRTPRTPLGPRASRLIVIMRSSGADIVEGFAALHGWGLAAKALTDCSGVVPIIMVVDGPAVSGPALLLGIADFVVMTADSYAFVTGPTMVAEFTGVVIDNEELGGAASHARYTGRHEPRRRRPRAAAIDMVAQLLAYLPQHNDEEPPPWPTDDPPDRQTPEAGTLMPQTSTGSYDVRDVIRAICDDGELLELRGRWAPNVVTAFATIGGMPIGIVANQPLALAGTLDIPASQKAARFVAFCDAFNLPILTLVDTPGFYPGKDLEWRGMIRHGAQLVFAYGRATVPRICVILRKSYGGAYIVMDSKTMGNDLCLAWPWAELAVMGAGQAAAILQRRATPEERAALRGRLRRAPAQPVHRGRAGVHRRGHRSGRDPPGDRRSVDDPDRQA